MCPVLSVLFVLFIVFVFFVLIAPKMRAALRPITSPATFFA